MSISKRLGLWGISLLRCPAWLAGLWAIAGMDRIRWDVPLRYFFVGPLSAGIVGILSFVPFVLLRRRWALLLYIYVFGLAYTAFFYDRAAPLYYVAPDYSGQLPARQPSGSAWRGDRPVYYVYDPSSHPDAPSSSALVFLLFASPPILATLYFYAYRNATKRA